MNLGSEVARTDRDATIVLRARGGLLHCLLEPGRSGLGEITGTHHAVLLEEIPHCGCNDVTHEENGEEIECAGILGCLGMLPQGDLEQITLHRNPNMQLTDGRFMSFKPSGGRFLTF